MTDYFKSSYVKLCDRNFYYSFYYLLGLKEPIILIAPYCCQYIAGGDCYDWESEDLVENVQYIDARRQEHL